MADKSKIEWTDATWNPITGCSLVSPGCTHCYAMTLAGTRLKNHPSRKGLTKPTDRGPVWTGEVRFNEQWLDQPIRWKKPRRVFVCAHGDLFHEDVPDEWIDQVFAVMALSPQHNFQVLTKRPDRMRVYGWLVPKRKSKIEEITAVKCSAAPYLKNVSVRWPLPNVWLGVSAEDLQRADERIPVLLDTPAAVRFVSLEPLLGPIDAYPYFLPRSNGGLDWVIAGGESGPGARPMHPDWVRSIRDQCIEFRVPFHFKQWGEWIEVDGPRCRSIRQDHHATDAWLDTYGMMHPRNPSTNRRFGVYGTSIIRRVGKKKAGRVLDGRTWDEEPA